ncbi:MAG: hypothetical protein ACFWT1_10615 [Selenomonas sp.]
MIVNHATELFTHPCIVSGGVPDRAYIKEQNLKILQVYGAINFIELDGSASYTFTHAYEGDMIGILKSLFKIDDIDLALYCIIHTYHKAVDEGYDGFYAITHHPQFEEFVNTEKFTLKEISPWGNIPLFSPFANEKKQNMNTRITPSKLVRAILAGQVKKVVCNGNSTDDWIRDAENNNWRGEWDKLDFAEHIWGTGNNFYCISREGNELKVSHACGEWSEDYTIYLNNQTE